MNKYENINDYTDEVISKLPHYYNREEDSNNYFILQLYLKEIYQINKTIGDLLNGFDIKKATGYKLDYFGNNFNLLRNRNENDTNYRVRILAEILTKAKNSTFDTILGVLKIIVENYKENIFIFTEGIKKSNSGDIDFNVYNGDYKGINHKQYYEVTGGTIYIVLNKKLPQATRDTILNTLIEIRAAGVEVTVDFKYKVQQASYICGSAFVGTKRMLYITDGFYDNITQTKTYESNLAKLNVITQEGVR